MERLHISFSSLPQTVLVVDDEPAVRTYHSRLLSGLGCRALCASSAAEARKLLEDNKEIEVILLNVNMPGETGLSFLDWTVSLAPEVVTVMVTGQYDVALAVEAMQKGARDFLLKPLDAQTLKTRLEKVYEWRALQIAQRRYQAEFEKNLLGRFHETVHQIFEVQTQRYTLLRSLCHLAEFRDPETGAHLDRVAAYSTLLAKYLALKGPSDGYSISPQFAEAIFDAAPLHDIGKVGIRDEILLKRGPLTQVEFEEMKRHTVIGAQVLERVISTLDAYEDFYLKQAREVALYHHERYDGKGYPEGLSGDQIPLCARIVSLADFYDACISPRPYRQELMTHEEVCGCVIERRGASFDPEVVTAFESLAPLFAEIANILNDQAIHPIREVRRLVEEMSRRIVTFA